MEKFRIVRPAQAFKDWGVRLYQVKGWRVKGDGPYQTKNQKIEKVLSKKDPPMANMIIF